jgi:hypothetical protein
MRVLRLRSQGWVCALAFGAILWQASAAAQNVSVTDYQWPVSSAARLLVDVTANHATKGSDTTASNGNIGGVYKRFYDSLPFGYSVDVIGSGALNRDPKTEDYESTYKVNGVAGVKRYLLENDPSLKDIFASARATANMDKAFDQPRTDVTIAVGNGRFINATALAKAVRVEQFLIESGDLREHLPKQAMIELSSIINRRAEYEDIHGATYKRIWYTDMEAVMRESGMLTGDAIGALGILRIDEVIEREQIADRFYGWDVAVGAKFDVTLADEDAERPPGNLDVTINYARPVSWQWQVNERLNVSSPFDELANDFAATLASDISYELSNRVDFRIRHLLTVRKPVEGDTEVGNSLGVSLIYYIENRVNLVATEKVEKSKGVDATTDFTLTLNYRVL